MLNRIFESLNDCAVVVRDTHHFCNQVYCNLVRHEKFSIADIYTTNGDIINTRAIAEWIVDDKRGLGFALEFLSVMVRPGGWTGMPSISSPQVIS